MAQHRLQRREAGAAGDHEHRARALAVAELSDRPLDAQQRPRRERRSALGRAAEQALGEAAAGHAAHVQLEERAVVRGTGDGEAAAPPVIEQHVQVLPGLEGQALDRRQAQEHLHHIRRERRQARDAARQGLDLHLRDAGDQPRRHGEGGCRPRLAQQYVPGLFLLGGEPERPAVRVADLPGEHARAARTAVAGLAAVRQVQPRGERGLQDRLPLGDLQGAAVRLDADAVLVQARDPRGLKGRHSWGLD